MPDEAPLQTDVRTTSNHFPSLFKLASYTHYHYSVALYPDIGSLCWWMIQPIALDEARLRAADRRERRLQREMEQLSRALQERKEGLRFTIPPVCFQQAFICH
jgi:hypothetical protein